VAWALLPTSDSSRQGWERCTLWNRVRQRPPRARPPRDLERGWTLRVARENLPLHCSLLAVRAVGEQPAAVAEHWQCLARDAEDIVCLLASIRTEARLIIDGTVCRGYGPAAGEIGALSRGVAAICTIAPGALPWRRLSLFGVRSQACERAITATMALLRGAYSLRRIWWSLRDSSVRENSRA
jgi:hypothetical protein